MCLDDRKEHTSARLIIDLGIIYSAERRKGNLSISERTAPVGLLSLILIAVALPVLMPTAYAASSSKLYPTADSWVRDWSPDTNYGGDITLHARSDTYEIRRIYFKFSLASIDPASICNATLWLYCSSATPGGLMDVDAHETGDGWAEMGITWNNAPAVGAYITTTAVNGTHKWYAWTGDAMKSYVVQEAAGDDTVSFVIKLPNDTAKTNPPVYHRNFTSRERWMTDQDPHLEITISEPPVALFTWDPESPQVCETVTFNASASYDPDCTIVKYEWDWNGDCTYDNETDNPIMTHHYDTHGTYTVKLKVTGCSGCTDVANASILVRAHPVANFTWDPPSPQVCETVTFDASASTPDGGHITDWDWDFNDTTTGTGEIVTHTYDTRGDYYVTLTVTDNETKSDSITKEIHVREPFIESSDADGNRKDEFSKGESVYVNGSDFVPSKTYDIYVVYDTTWTDGMAIPSRVPGTATSITTDGDGAIAYSDLEGSGTSPALIWGSAEKGKYDIIVDANNNGKYDLCIDPLDDLDVDDAGFIVPVGGKAVPINVDINTPHLLSPQIGLAFALLAAMAVTIILVRRRNKTSK